jgi:hypothetical protein
MLRGWGGESSGDRITRRLRTSSSTPWGRCGRSELDRLSRSLKDLLHIMEQIERAGTGFCSYTEAIDTTTPAGRMLMQMVGNFAEFERAMIRERTQVGLVADRARGRIGGCRPVLGPVQQAEIVAMVTSGRKTQAEAVRVFKVHPATVSRLLAIQRQQAHPHNPPGMPLLSLRISKTDTHAPHPGRGVACYGKAAACARSCIGV